MLFYAVSQLNIPRIEAKIGLSNAPSRALFRSLHFVPVSESAVFQEATVELVVDSAIAALRGHWQALAPAVLRHTDPAVVVHAFH